MKHSLIHWGNRFFDKSWRIIAFQPVLYLILWAAAIRLGLDHDDRQLSFDAIAPTGFYGVWITMGIICPMTSLLSWFLIQKRYGRQRFIGVWLRLASDVGVLTTIVAYHAAVIMMILDDNDIDDEQYIYARYLQSATILFVAMLVIRDVWSLVIIERLARTIHYGENDE